MYYYYREGRQYLTEPVTSLVEFKRRSGLVLLFMCHYLLPFFRFCEGVPGDKIVFNDTEGVEHTVFMLWFKFISTSTNLPRKLADLHCTWTKKTKNNTTCVVCYKVTSVRV